MKKLNKTVFINGIIFEVVNKIEFTQGYKGLFDAYKAPSKYKYEIWQGWLNWFANCKRNESTDFIEIASRNTSVFTIQGKIQNCKFKITPKHNYIQLQSLDNVTIE